MAEEKDFGIASQEELPTPQAGPRINEAIVKTAKEILDLKLQADELKAKKTGVEKQIKAAKTVLLEQMRDQEIEGFRAHGHSFFPQQRVGAKVKDEAGLHQYLKDNGLEDMIKASVHASTLKSYIAELLADGKSTPDRVDVSVYTDVGIQKV